MDNPELFSYCEDPTEKNTKYVICKMSIDSIIIYILYEETSKLAPISKLTIMCFTYAPLNSLSASNNYKHASFHLDQYNTYIG